MSDKIGNNTRGRAGLGRPRGALNVTTRTLKAALEASFNEVGGTRWLVELAKSEPRAYAALLAKLLPSQVNMDASVTAYEPITEIRRTIVDVKARDDEV
ncbi:hypothetical protein HAP93_03540 [Acidithiobacillus ferriphilus]|uniref:hypothetical protein n=1 Tax=Acidithiobacillus ferriphilus TaxID=1689834 RepID=UPI001C062967|nr:hypothetical protein [Acidithiobacillus ferriphilus]MBU2784848.1 hypothetical protein [Acidithiobacillus ferriphilus]MBU2845198.1 hypothetical protein [Acidithiobacillus ferriphilus]